MVLEKKGEDQWNRLCEKRKSVTYNQGEKEYPPYNEKKEG
jgi:hypothetical protein